MANTPNPGSKYPWTPNSADLAVVKKMIEMGANEATVARRLGVSFKTFKEKKKAYPAIQDTIDEAKQDIETEIVGKLMKIIRDDDHKHNFASILFYLKTQCRWRETNVVEQTVTTTAPDGFMFKVITSSVKNPGPVEPEEPKDGEQE